MTWDLSRTDWQKRITAGQSLMPDIPQLSPLAADAVRTFNGLRLPDVPGQPPLRDAAGEWFRELVAAMFGSWDGTERHIREAFVLVPKKSSKTSYSAALMVTALIVNTRPRAEYLLVAPTQEIALLAFRQAVGMIEAAPRLARSFRIQEHIKTITLKSSGAFLKIKSFDPKVVTGSKPSGILLDEMHVIAESPQADRVIGQLRGGLVSQPEGFLISITTQSERTPSGVFLSELRKARAVRDGKLSAPILPLLYEFHDGVDWRDQEKWWMVTPNRGRSITIERLVDDYDQAVAAGEHELRRWASQHLNVEVGVALATDRWAGAEFWEACAVDRLELADVLERSEVVTIGIDGGGLDDLLGLAVLGRCATTGRWLLWCHAWAHEIVLERRQQDAPRLLDYQRDGSLTVCQRIGSDVADVSRLCYTVWDSGLLDKIGCDPHGLGSIVEKIAEAGVPDDCIIGVSQGWRLGGAIKTLERRLAEQTLEHDGSAMMRWVVGNAKVEQRGNGAMITKQISGVAKIDPLMAALDAVTLMALHPAAKNGIDAFLSDPLVM